jgi:hypothetical protein
MTALETQVGPVIQCIARREAADVAAATADDIDATTLYLLDRWYRCAPSVEFFVQYPHYVLRPPELGGRLGEVHEWQPLDCADELPLRAPIPEVDRGTDIAHDGVGGLGPHEAPRFGREPETDRLLAIAELDDSKKNLSTARTSGGGLKPKPTVTSSISVPSNWNTHESPARRERGHANLNAT